MSDKCNKNILRRTALLVMLLVMSTCPRARLLASTISFTGDLRNDASFTACGPGCVLGAGNTDGDYAQWAAVVQDFTVAAPSTMQAVTFSYGGGVNGVGMIIPEGGFEPYLSLFDASGNLLASTFFGITCPPGANTNTLSGQCLDVALDGGTLAAGNYQLSISAFENLSLAENLGSGTLADGFAGLGNLFPGEDMHYAFDVILNTPSSAVPEPAGLSPLFTIALGLLAFHRSRKGKRS